MFHLNRRCIPVLKNNLLGIVNAKQMINIVDTDIHFLVKNCNYPNISFSNHFI